MTALLPDPVPLDPPPGDPGALEELTGRLNRAADVLGELGEQLSEDAGAVPTWVGDDAVATTARVQRVGGLAREAADALLRAGARVALHRELLEDARRRLARLRTAQEEDYGAAAARLGGSADPTIVGVDTGGAFDELHRGEAARGREAEAIRDEVTEDAAATAGVLADCSAVAGGGGRPGDATDVSRYLTDLLPGWHEMQLAQRGRELAADLRAGDEFSQEAAARELLPWAGSGAFAAALLTGLGADGFREVLRRLGDGSLSSGSALARLMAAALDAPVPPADADEVAGVRDVRHVDPADYRTLDSDLVALGMGVVLAAGRGVRSAGPPAATVREWGRQIMAREQAMGGERIVDRVRSASSYARPGDPLEEVLLRLAGTDDPAPASTLLRAQPTWSYLLGRPWDDGGAAFGALVERSGRTPGSAGDVAVRSGLRALAAGLGDDGDPARWTVDRGTVAEIAPKLAEAVATRPDVVTDPLAQAAAGESADPRQLLRGLGYLSSEPAAATVLDRGLEGAAPVVAAGYTAVREYGQRLAHALDEFAAKEQAEDRMHLTDAAKEGLALVPRVGEGLAALVAVGSVLGDLDGTWDESADRGERFNGDDAAAAAGGAPGAQQAYQEVSALLGAPVAPESPPIDWPGLVGDLLPVRGPLGEVVDRTYDLITDLLEDRAGAPRDASHPSD